MILSILTIIAWAAPGFFEVEVARSKAEGVGSKSRPKWLLSDLHLRKTSLCYFFALWDNVRHIVC